MLYLELGSRNPILQSNHSSATLQTSLSPLGARSRNKSNAFWARSTNVSASTILCLLGLIMPDSSRVGMMSGCRCHLKNSF